MPLFPISKTTVSNNYYSYAVILEEVHIFEISHAVVMIKFLDKKKALKSQNSLP